MIAKNKENIDSFFIDSFNYFKNETIKYFEPNYKPVAISNATLKANSHYQKNYLLIPQYHDKHGQILVSYTPKNIKLFFSYDFIKFIYSRRLNYEQLLKILPIKEKLENVRINGKYIVFDLKKYLDCKNYQLAINDFLNFRIVSDILK
jgi:hypothetical protein